MDTFTSYPTEFRQQPARSGHGTAALDAFASFSGDYGMKQLAALPAGERSRIDGPALAALALILAGLPVLTLALEKLA